MIVKTISFLFTKLVGRVPEPRRTELRNNLESLLISVVEAGAEGAVKGAKDRG